MQIQDIVINPDNHHEYDLNMNEYHTWSREYKDAFDANLSLNSYLDHALGNTIDWGGAYNTWLTKLGIEPNSDNGWWSIDAVRPENIAAFVRDGDAKTDEDFKWQIGLDQARQVFTKLKTGISHQFNTVDGFIEFFSGLQVQDEQSGIDPNSPLDTYAYEDQNWKYSTSAGTPIEAAIQLNSIRLLSNMPWLTSMRLLCVETGQYYQVRSEFEVKEL